MKRKPRRRSAKALQSHAELVLLRSELDELCGRLTKLLRKVVGLRGITMVAVLKALSRHDCLGCIIRELRHRANSRADAIYIEEHQFAVASLVTELQERLGGLASVKREVATKYLSLIHI